MGSRMLPVRSYRKEIAPHTKGVVVGNRSGARGAVPRTRFERRSRRRIETSAFWHTVPEPWPASVASLRASLVRSAHQPGVCTGTSLAERCGDAAPNSHLGMAKDVLRDTRSCAAGRLQ